MVVVWAVLLAISLEILAGVQRSVTLVTAEVILVVRLAFDGDHVTLQIRKEKIQF